MSAGSPYGFISVVPHASTRTITAHGPIGSGKLHTDHMHLRRMAGDEIGAQGCLRLRPLRFILEEPPGRGHRPFLALGQGRTQTGAGTEG